jgi:hypothetical protein
MLSKAEGIEYEIIKLGNELILNIYTYNLLNEIVVLQWLWTKEKVPQLVGIFPRNERSTDYLGINVSNLEEYSNFVRKKFLEFEKKNQG